MRDDRHEMRDDKSILLLRTAGAMDGAGFEREEVSAIVRLSTSTSPDVEIIAIGGRTEVEAHPAAKGHIPIELPHHVLIPGLTNAHAHLDLTHLGPMPFDRDAGFVAWIGGILKARDELATPVPMTVQQGIAKSLAGGVVAIGDISGTPEAAQTLRDGPLRGVGFLEVFGLGERIDANWQRALDALQALHAPCSESAALRISVQPHAPYSAGREIYAHAARWSAAHNMPMATHWSETPAEMEFVAHATGPMCDFLKRLGAADAGALQEFGHGETPIAHVADAVRGARIIAAHINSANDEDIDLLAQLGATVAYCPRASAYFEHDIMFGPHRYLEMLAAGVNVALGTDSIVCHPHAQADRLSTLDEARLLYQRDGLSPHNLMAMITLHGARALGLDESLFQFPKSGGRMGGLFAVDVRGTTGRIGERIMRTTCAPEQITCK